MKPLMHVLSPGHRSDYLSPPLLYLILLLCALIISVALLAAVPPVSRDALTHHLYIPKLYIEHGGIYQIPHIEFSYFPMNLDLLYMIPLALGNDIIPKYIHFFFAILTALLIWRFLADRAGSLYGLLGGLFFLSIPVIVKLSISVYVDLGLIFFSTAALLLILNWLREVTRIRYLIGAAICCGLSLGTKYNGLITFFLLTTFLPLLYSKSNPSNQQGIDYKPFLYAAFFVLISLLVFSPWMIRNYIWTENPLYPLFGSLFGTGETEVMGGMSPFLLRKIIYHESWLQTLLIPIRIFFEGQDNNPQFFDGRLNPFLFLLPLFAFIPASKAESSKDRLEKYTLLAFAVLFLFFAFFQRDLRIRYIGPIIPPLVILSIFSIKNLIELVQQQQRDKIVKITTGAVWCLVIIMFTLNFSYLFKQFNYIKPLDYLLSSISRDEYITRFRPEYPVIQYANKEAEAGSKLLCIFLGNRGYYLNIDHSFDLQDGKSVLCDIVQQAGNPFEVVDSLKMKGFTHLLIREDLWRSWITKNLNAEQLDMLNTFMNKNITPLFQNNIYTLYTLNRTGTLKTSSKETGN